jgi:hypothetical protein
LKEETLGNADETEPSGEKMEREGEATEVMADIDLLNVDSEDDGVEETVLGDVSLLAEA